MSDRQMPTDTTMTAIIDTTSRLRAELFAQHIQALEDGPPKENALLFLALEFIQQGMLCLAHLPGMTPAKMSAVAAMQIDRARATAVAMETLRRTTVDQPSI